MRAIARAYASTCTTSLMRVNNSTCHFVYDTSSLGHLNEENERKLRKAATTVTLFSSRIGECMYKKKQVRVNSMSHDFDASFL